MVDIISVMFIMLYIICNYVVVLYLSFNFSVFFLFFFTTSRVCLWGSNDDDDDDDDDDDLILVCMVLFFSVNFLPQRY